MRHLAWAGSDVLAQFRALPEGLSCSFFFDDTGAEPLYSYIQLDAAGRIVSVREKQAISTLANTGAYGFCRCEGHSPLHLLAQLHWTRVQAPPPALQREEQTRLFAPALLPSLSSHVVCSGAMLKSFCAHAVNQSLPAEEGSHAYYVSALITRMLEHGHPFQVG
jgi:hypothetical protein